MDPNLPIDPVTGMPLVGPPVMGAAPPMAPPAMGPAMPPPIDISTGAPVEEPEPPMPDPLELMVEVLMSGSPADVEALIETMDDASQVQLRRLVEDEIEPRDPQRAKMLLAYLPEPSSGARLPKWWENTYGKDGHPPRPQSDEVIQTAKDDAEAWREVIDDDHNVMKFVLNRPDSHYHFKTFNAEKDAQYKSSALTDEMALVVNKVSATSFTYEVTTTDPALKEAVQQTEDFLYYADRQTKAMWADDGNGDYDRELAWSLVTRGRIVELVQPDFEDDCKFLDERIFDPSTTFPVWEGKRGLQRVTRIYEDTLANALGDYDLDGKLRKKVIGAKIVGTNEVYQLKSRVKVTCYWDRWWYMVLINDIEALCAEHKYGRVPFVVTGSYIGIPKWANDQVGDPELTGTHQADDLMKYRYAKHITSQIDLFANREAIGTLLLTALMKADKPPMVIYQDPVAAANGTPEVERDSNDVTPLMKDREELAPLLESTTAPQVFGPLYQIFGQDMATNKVPMVAFGISEGANQSGNAMENALEAGNDKLVPHFQAIARHKAARAKLRLEFWRDFGNDWENSRGQTGRMAVPYSRGRRRLQPKDAPPAFDFTPETVDQVGTAVEVNYTMARQQNLIQFGNAFAVLNTNNAMSVRESMELRGVENPDDAMQEIRYERIMNQPEVLQIETLDYLRKRDPELADKYEAMMGGGGGPSQNGQMPPPGGIVGPNSSALNLTGLGMGAVGETGRPAVTPPGVGGIATPPPGIM